MAGGAGSRPWAALALIAGGAGAFFATRGSSGSKGHGMAMPPSNATHAMHSALDKALTLADESALSKGDLLPSACRQQGATMVTCPNPTLAIGTAAFRVYPSLAALYSAYVAKVQSIAPGPFRANYANCNTTTANGEVSWNHSFFHSTAYSLAQTSSGMLKPETQAAGRIFCYLSNAGQEYIVWTQNAGLLLARASGGPHADVLAWWGASTTTSTWAACICDHRVPEASEPVVIVCWFVRSARRPRPHRVRTQQLAAMPFHAASPVFFHSSGVLFGVLFGVPARQRAASR